MDLNKQTLVATLKALIQTHFLSSYIFKVYSRHAYRCSDNLLYSYLNRGRHPAMIYRCSNIWYNTEILHMLALCIEFFVAIKAVVVLQFLKVDTVFKI